LTVAHQEYASAISAVTTIAAKLGLVAGSLETDHTRSTVAGPYKDFS
jgi:hypothetical protein